MGGYPAWFSNQWLFAHSSPLLMVFFLVLSSWANLYHLCWRHLVHPLDTSVELGVQFSSNRAAGLALLIMSTLLKATWLGAWVQILVITWFCDRKWKPQRSSRNIMQVDSHSWNDAMESSRGWCIPYEEAVYLRTIKAYLYVAVFLPVDAVFSLAVSVYALANHQVPAAPFASSVIMGAILAMLVSLMLTYDRIWFLAFKNVIGPERLTRAWLLGFKYDERSETRLHLQTFEGRHPWDLGISENLHQVLGRHWWQWLFFWWQPERVSHYGKYAGRDLPYADWVIRYRTDFLMVPLVHVAIEDGPGAFPSHGQVVPVHRRRQRSTRSSTHAEEPAPASAAPAPAAPAAARDGRRRFEFSFSSSSSQ
ncbi:hypothetical protein DL762_003701 [Monosporascus cannonballus]|uniref:Uncharacterized protein n=1 Tax=Monosporascus cannonballus TaxID=155416 RepID=A0ABY0HAG6_9PEZI|nr:hypothetical protein DL762_003701 [Monosporascus cannonballus]